MPSLRSRLAAVGSQWPLPRRTIRLRLTVTYGGLFLLCGTGLLAVVYVLVRFRFPTASAHNVLHPPTGSGITGGLSPLPSLASLQVQADLQRAADLHQLLIVCGLALAGMLVVSSALGWLVAGRVLRPLRTITAAAQQLSSSTLDRRLALSGPDDELKRLGDTFDDLLARLERSFTAQRQFVANASHELRTPLTLQRALLDAALSDRAPTADTFRATCRRLVTLNADQGRMIEALLTLADTERGLERREPLDLAELAGQVLASRRTQAERSGLRLQVELECAPTTGDPELVERLIDNLIDNAIRYNGVNGQVEVATGTQPGSAFLCVANVGPTVTADQIEEMFRPFRRLGANRGDARTGDHHGHGLGLSIVASIASAHHATLTTVPGTAGGLMITAQFPID